MPYSRNQKAAPLRPYNGRPYVGRGGYPKSQGRRVGQAGGYDRPVASVAKYFDPKQRYTPLLPGRVYQKKSVGCPHCRPKASDEPKVRTKLPTKEEEDGCGAFD